MNLLIQQLDWSLVLAISLIVAIGAFTVPVRFRYLEKIAAPGGKGALWFVRCIIWCNRFFLWPFGFFILPIIFLKGDGVGAFLIYAMVVGQACYAAHFARTASIVEPLRLYRTPGSGVQFISAGKFGFPMHIFFIKRSWERRYLLLLELLLIVPLLFKLLH